MSYFWHVVGRIGNINVAKFDLRTAMFDDLLPVHPIYHFDDPLPVHPIYHFLTDGRFFTAVAGIDVLGLDFVSPSGFQMTHP